MKLPVRIAFLFLAISVIISAAMFWAGEGMNIAEMSPLWNMFFLIVTISTSLFLVSKKDGYADKSFVEDFKVAMQGGIIFVLFLSFFTFIYHEYIDTSYVDYKVEERLQANFKNVPDEATYLKLQAKDLTWQDKSYLDYIENQEDQSVMVLSAKSLAIGHLGAGLFLALFFAIISSFVFRKIVLR